MTTTLDAPATTTKRPPRGRGARGITVCGYCAGAPRMRSNPADSHYHCPGGACACYQAGHRPTPAIRSHQARYCDLTVEQVVARDHGLDPTGVREHQERLARRTVEPNTTTRSKSVSTIEAPLFARREGEPVKTQDLSRAELREALNGIVVGAANLRRDDAVKLYVDHVIGKKAVTLKCTPAGKLVKADAPSNGSKPSSTKKAPAKKAPAKRSSTKRAPAKKAPAKKASPAKRAPRKAATK
jgi:hypothetical protein